jgi:hypothetical protein
MMRMKETLWTEHQMEAVEVVGKVYCGMMKMAWRRVDGHTCGVVLQS